jgi:hypothetical protein
LAKGAQVFGEAQMMQLWTHHPHGFRLDSAHIVIDPTKGRYWRDNIAGLRYRDVLPKLQQLLGTRQFLWCYTIRTQPQNADLVEWELNLPESQILRFVHSWVWETIVWGNPDGWQNLFADGRPDAGKDIHALVSWPLPPAWVKCHERPLNSPGRGKE